MNIAEMNGAEPFSWEIWGKSLKSIRGLFLVTVMLPDGTVFTPHIAYDVSDHGIGEALKSISETFKIIRIQEPDCWQARWIYKKATLHAFRLSDTTTVVALSSHDRQFDHQKLEQIMLELKLTFETALN